MGASQKFLSKNTKGQGSVEFVIITSIMFFIIIGVAIAMQMRLSTAYEAQVYGLMEELGELVNTEVTLAYASPGDYERSFFLPNELEQYNYSISLYDKTEAVISSAGLNYIVFFDTSVEGSLAKGWNRITKKDGVIRIEQQ